MIKMKHMISMAEREDYLEEKSGPNLTKNGNNL